MITMDVTYTNIDGKTVTEQHHFNLNAEEIMEKDLQVGGIEETMDRLGKTEKGAEAYALFKDIVLSTYGIREGKFFRKIDRETNRPYVEDFIDSGAAGAMIVEFIQNPLKGAKFIQGCLPPKEELDRLQANMPTDEERAEIERQVAAARAPQDRQKKQAEVIAQLPGDDGEEYTGPRGGRKVTPNLESRKVEDTELPDEPRELTKAEVSEMDKDELLAKLTAGFTIEK